MIELEDLVFSYPHSDFELAIANLKIARQERVAVIGASGSGKSTLLNLIAGVLVPDSGALSVDQCSIGGLDDAARRVFRISNIGFVLQDFELIEYLSVLDNIVHPYRICDSLTLTTEVAERAVALAERIGIAGKINRHPGELSQGEKQRVAICRALINSPSLLLADEATGNLDPDNKQRIMDLVFECADLSQATLLAVTHDHGLLSRFDRVIDANEFRALG
jgi:putative ABC transport system ATP-binding protein